MKRKYLLGAITGVVLIVGMAFTYQQKERYFDIIKNLEIFSNMYKEVNSNYVDEIDRNPGPVYQLLFRIPDRRVAL
jgi:carboxyl-terminal processing protease